uniref:Uncharacterized protein n=1 Tax=Rhizophora mucronata TaxID=61149 RepID=A0A2P2PH68_RHIMU
MGNCYLLFVKTVVEY